MALRYEAQDEELLEELEDFEAQDVDMGEVLEGDLEDLEDGELPAQAPDPPPGEAARAKRASAAAAAAASREEEAEERAGGGTSTPAPADSAAKPEHDDVAAAPGAVANARLGHAAVEQHAAADASVAVELALEDVAMKPDAGVKVSAAEQRLVVRICGALDERKFHVVRALVGRFGPDLAERVLDETLETEKRGGMQTADGSRRRTPGGAFLELFKRRVPAAELKGALDAVKEEEKYYREEAKRKRREDDKVQRAQKRTRRPLPA